MAVEFRFHWYIDAKAAMTGSLKINEPSRLPLLIYALYSDEWVVGKLVPVPDCTLVEKLLTHGADPNQRCEQYTIWQYVIHYLSLDVGTKSKDILTWSTACVLMLQHGADPYAYSPETCTASKDTLMLGSQKKCGPKFLCKSAASIIRDTFEGQNGDGEKLTRLLEEKKIALSHTKEKKKPRKGRKMTK